MNEPDSNLNLFAYRDFREFLRDFCHIQKAHHGNRYSYRNLGRQVGFHSPNYLLLITQGHRQLPDDKILSLAHVLKLSDRQTRFFKSLVLYTQETDPNKKAGFLHQLSQFDESGLTQDVAKNTATYLSHWYHPTVRETAMTMSLSKSRHQKILKKIEEFKTEIQSLVTDQS